MEDVGGRGGSLSIYFFVIEKYVKDVEQGQKVAPDLVESIMKPPDPVKEELRRRTKKMSQFRPKNQEIWVSTFWMSGKSADSRRRPTQPASLVSFMPITAPQTLKTSKICRF